MKLEVGMYVRTQNNGIAKIKSFHSNIYDDYICISHCFDLVRKKEITKASHNIIDLIEAGDYVNGYKVKKTGIEELGHTYLSLDMNEDIHWLESEIENKEQIKSIVTKEQFESMSYKVEE